MQQRRGRTSISLGDSYRHCRIGRAHPDVLPELFASILAACFEENLLASRVVCIVVGASASSEAL